MRKRTPESGFCQCGCGRMAPIAKRTDSLKGWKKGEPIRFIKGHQLTFGKYGVRDLESKYSVNEQTGCWEWNKSLTKGYGSEFFRGKKFQAHRFVYELNRGTIPIGMTLDHLCRNRRCVNPDHLEIVTRGENSRRGSATITPVNVADIRAMAARGVLQKEIGAMFKLSQQQISRIVNEQRWSHV